MSTYIIITKFKYVNINVKNKIDMSKITFFEHELSKGGKMKNEKSEYIKNYILLFSDSENKEKIFYTENFFENYKVGIDIYGSKQRDLIEKIVNVNFNSKYRHEDVLQPLYYFFYLFSKDESINQIKDFMKQLESIADADEFVEKYFNFSNIIKDSEYFNFYYNFFMLETENIFFNKVKELDIDNETFLSKKSLLNNFKNIVTDIKNLYRDIDIFLEEYVTNNRISLKNYIDFKAIPKTGKILYMKEHGIKVGKYLLKEELKNIDNKLSNEYKCINEIIDEKKLYKKKYIKVDDFYFENYYIIESFCDYLMGCINYILEKKPKINKCKNCGKYFIPQNKVNEELCNNIYKNNKTCKELAYEIKLEKDEITNIYRKNYKTQNAKKQRNLHIKNIESRFKRWCINAKAQKENCENGDISIEEFKKWLDENKNWHINK